MRNFPQFLRFFLLKFSLIKNNSLFSWETSRIHSSITFMLKKTNHLLFNLAANWSKILDILKEILTSSFIDIYLYLAILLLVDLHDVVGGAVISHQDLGNPHVRLLQGAVNNVARAREGFNRIMLLLNISPWLGYLG